MIGPKTRLMQYQRFLILKLKQLPERLRKIAMKFLIEFVKIVLNKHVIQALEVVFKEYIIKQNKELLRKLQACGYGVRINGKIYVREPNKLILGNNVHIGEGCYFAAEGGLTIGDNTHISRNVTIYTINHNYEGSSLPYDCSYLLKPVAIRKNVWIGMNVCIVPGVRIGDGAIIGMGTVVSRDVAAGTIVGSPPQRVLKTRNNEHYRLTDSLKKYGGRNGLPINDKIFHFKQHPIEKADQLFFILSTGRSGTKSFAKILSQHPEINCIHERSPQLIRLSTEFAHNIKSKEQVKDELFDIYSTTVVPAKVYGESDQKFWNLIPIMNEIFPECRFIWLLRDGSDVVASTFSLGWFSEKENEARNPNGPGTQPWQYYRLNGFKCGCYSQNEWNQMSVFERNCWYWSYVNKTIEQSLSKIEKERWLKVRLEDLVKDIARIESFLGVRPLPLKLIHTNRKHPRQILKWETWDLVMRSQFYNQCSSGMDKHYPGWNVTRFLASDKKIGVEVYEC